MGKVLPFTGSLSARDAELIKSVVEGIVPELRAHFDAQIKEVAERCDQRVAAAEQRADAADQRAATADQRATDLEARIAGLERTPPFELDLGAVRAVADEAISALPAPEPVEIDWDRVRTVVEEAAAALPPTPAAEVDLEDLQRRIDEGIAAIPPTPAAEVDMNDVQRRIEDVVALIPVAPAAEVDMAAVGELVTQAVSDAVPPAVDSAVAAAVGPAVAEAVAEIPAVEPLPVDMEEVRSIVGEAVGEAVAAIPPVEPLAPDVDEVRGIVSEQVAAAFATVELPRGKDADMDLLRSHIDGRVETVVAEQLPEAVAAAMPAAPEIDMDRVGELVENCVSNAVGAIPKPKDGAPCDMEAVARQIEDHIRKGFDAQPAPRDGIGLASAVIDRDGHLVLTLSDGREKDLGLVVGKDGKTFTAEDIIFDQYDDLRTCKIGFQQGDTLYSWELNIPCFIDQGVWSEKAKYVKGDGVTWGGSFWIAQRDATGKPDTAESGWRMAVRKGRDAKPAT